MSHSKCCKKDVWVLSGENSSYYVCRWCQKPCDLDHGQAFESGELHRHQKLSIEAP